MTTEYPWAQSACYEPKPITYTSMSITSRMIWTLAVLVVIGGALAGAVWI